MKKLTALALISMFALAACQPMNLTASGAGLDAAVESLNDPSIETEDASGNNSSDDGSETSESEGSESSDSMDMESSSEADEMSSSDDSYEKYSVEVTLEGGAVIPEELTLHEGSTITWTNNDSVSYTISIMKMDDSSDDSDDSMDDSSDGSYNDDSLDDSTYATELTVEPGQTISFIVPDSGDYQFTISGGMVSLSGMIYVSDSESDDSYDDYMDDGYDDSNDDMVDDSSDDSYDDSYDDSDDSYDDSDEYEDEEDDSEDEEDSHSSLFLFLS